MAECDANVTACVVSGLTAVTACDAKALMVMGGGSPPVWSHVTVTSGCRGGHFWGCCPYGYADPMCDACLPGFKKSSGLCVQCSGDSSEAMINLAIIVGGAIGAFVLVKILLRFKRSMRFLAGGGRNTMQTMRNTRHHSTPHHATPASAAPSFHPPSARHPSHAPLPHRSPPSLPHSCTHTLPDLR